MQNNFEIPCRKNREGSFTEEEKEILRMFDNSVIIRNHLERYGSITQNEALDIYGIGRLAAVIEQLRHKKEPLMNIITVKEAGKNRLGKKSKYGRYYFKPED